MGHVAREGLYVFLRILVVVVGRYLAEIERRRDIGTARLSARRRHHSEEAGNSLIRFTGWTLVGAASLVAYALYRATAGGRLEWSSSSWWWWFWTSSTPPPT